MSIVKKHILLLASGIMMLIPVLSFSQNRRLDMDELLELNHETPGDPYLPNAYNNEKTSPSYQFRRGGAARTTGSSVFTKQVNVNANGRNIVGDAANEPSIAVNPVNPNSIAIGWRQFDNVASNFRQAGWGYTDNAGLSWTASKIDPGVFHSDPVLDYDAEGNFFYNSLLQSFNTLVYKSTDGGASWGVGVNARGGDKQWMTIDRTAGIGKGNVYSSWTSSYSTCSPGFFTRSANGGSSFENCIVVSGYPFYATMTVGNAGELYIAGGRNNSNDLVFCKSLNAQTAGSTISWSTPKSVFMDGSIGNTSANPQGLLGQVNIDVDRSGTASNGNIYVLAALSRISNSDGADVMFAKSTDGGLTWKAPVRVNDDLSESNTQWLAAMAVAPNGRIDAAWLDTRDAVTGSDSSALYYSYSLDQGATWSVNEKLSDLFNPHVGYPNQNKMGDYFDMVSDNGGAHLAWTNTLNGEQDVYYSRIVPGAILTGLSEADLAAAAFTIFPNPNSGTFSITGLNEHFTVEIYNMLGGKVYTQVNYQSGTEIKIDLPKVASGIYVVKLFTEDGRSVIMKMMLD